VGRQSRMLDREPLQTLYVEQGLSMAAVAHHTKTNVRSVRHWLVEHGISVRSSSAFRHHATRANAQP
jgi:hypothetical protein